MNRSVFYKSFSGAEFTGGVGREEFPVERAHLVSRRW